MKRNLSKIVVGAFTIWIVVRVMKLFHDGNCTMIAAELEKKSKKLTRWDQYNESLKRSVIGIFSPYRPAEGLETSKSLDSEIQRNELLNEPSAEHRLRAVHNQIEEMWYYIQSLKQRFQYPSDVIENLQKRKNAALVELELLQLSQKDIIWNELDEMKQMVAKKIRKLQEPENCSLAKKLLCNFGDKCGFGCQVHHVAVCFALALGTGRTLILDASKWSYSGKPWDEVFMPISSPSCESKINRAVLWTSQTTEADIEKYDVVKVEKFNWRSPPPYLPLRVPKYLYQKLAQYHGDPPAWWLGQLVSYLIRPQPWLSTKINEHEKRIGFQRPIAGIHIRRTDKLKSEASFHDISEYMLHVVDWFEKESMKRQRMGEPSLERRRVYIASDDPTVLDEARKRYPEYEFFGDRSISVMTNSAGRYSLNGVIGLMTDVTLLSKCDFFVGTFSSGMSRLVYEMMQIQHADPTSNVRSLDDLYYYVNQFGREQRAIYDHVPHNPDEIDMKVGDIIGIRGNHWNGYSLGTSTKTRQSGLYPSYKTIDIISFADFKLHQ